MGNGMRAGHALSDTTTTTPQSPLPQMTCQYALWGKGGYMREGYQMHVARAAASWGA